ncbi:MAG: flagellar biosynthesis repressor FlbT [Magnetospirillum sp.]|nr:flagellar biosynthesis repressor FlbT [Magnetospirillum sp.]
MPLLIDLKPGEKVIINGAVIENAGANTKLRVHNESNILRQKEILANTEISTPASRVYFCLQCAYIFPEKREHYLGLFEHYLVEYVEACPSAAEIAVSVRSEVNNARYYKALKAARMLLRHEADVLDHLRSTAEAEGGGAVSGP